MNSLNIESFAWQTLLKLQRSSVGIRFVDALYHSRVIDFYDKISYRRDASHPTAEMLEEGAYFTNQKSRILSNLGKLADKKSREIYKNIIAFRSTHAAKDRPEYNRFNQYFPQDVVDLSLFGKVFVDCGAYNGDTASSFFHILKKRDLKDVNFKYIAFEPDRFNVEMIRKRFPSVIVKQSAVYSQEGFLSFSEGGGSVSRISHEEGAQSVAASTIDATQECSDATFIKMDIEGSEWDALLGAQKTIHARRPLLAICIYHSKEDMIRLQELIDSWDLGYQFYIRHHAPKISETVLYCIPRNR